jgi:uncharacterized protein (DUF4415 family)
MTGNKRALGSNLTQVDAHEITPEEYEEIPELTDEWFAKAKPHENGRLVRRGRPRLDPDARKQTITLRLSPEVIAALRASGPGWNARVDEILRTSLKVDD